MADERPLPPSRARRERAWRAGLRPRSRLLALSLAALVGVLLVDELVGTRLAEAVAVGDDLAQAPGLAASAALRKLAVGTVSLAGLWLAVVVAAGLITRTLGPITGPTRAGDRFVPPRDGLALVIVGVAVVGTVVALTRGVVAGAARAPAATESGLVQLWGSWGGRSLVEVAALAAAAGIAVWWWRRRAIEASLYQTHAQARAESEATRGSPQ